MVMHQLHKVVPATTGLAVRLMVTPKNPWRISSSDLGGGDGGLGGGDGGLSYSVFVLVVKSIISLSY